MLGGPGLLIYRLLVQQRLLFALLALLLLPLAPIANFALIFVVRGPPTWMAILTCAVWGLLGAVQIRHIARIHREKVVEVARFVRMLLTEN
jgi:hypothetical protein